MKIRAGFVSNSSSSSFIVISKKGKLTKDKLMGAFKLPDKHFLKDVIINIINFIYDNAELKSMQDYIDDGYEVDNIPEEVKKAWKQEYKVYEGSFSNDSGNSIEGFLYEEGLGEYEDENIIISDSGGC